MSNSSPPAVAGASTAVSQGPSTVPNPPATPAQTGTGFPQHHPQPFHSTPLKPSPNPWHIDPVAGKARRVGLVDDTGMGTRFHQLGLNTFNAIIPGDLPSNADRERFLEPEMGNNKMLEHDIGIELTKTIQSILDAAGIAHGLEALHTPYHKAKGDHGNPEATVNDIGIYLATETAQRVTHLTKRKKSRSTFTLGHLEDGRFGSRSWYWLAILGEVKRFSSPMCAFNMIPRLLPLSQAGVAPIDPSDDDVPLFPAPSVDREGKEDGSDAASATAKPTAATSRVISIGDPYIKTSQKAELGLGQFAEYMHNLLTHQHRHFAYGFYVQWKYARLLYFDRTGALISEPFDWTVKTSLLHDFVWKVAHMTPEQLGYDPTAQLASESEIELLRSNMGGEEFDSLPVEVQEYVLKAFPCKATQPTQATTTESGNSSATQSDKPPKAKPKVALDEVPIYKLTVTRSDPSPDEAFPDRQTLAHLSPTPATSGTDAAGERTFLVGRPHFAASSLIGRCTRGYIAFDLQAKVFCFLKDFWRPLVPGRSRPEHLVYERLHDRNVGNIASLVCGGDVGGHRAQVTHVQDSMSPEKKPVPRVHYRIVIKEIGIPLTEFKNFTELVGFFGDALAAYMAAYEDAKILHRDISIGNILIDPQTRSGFLIDWDLSRLVSELGDGPMEPDRTGTWLFRSALSLRYPRKPYRVSDDVESFVHAFLYMVLRFHPTTLVGLRSHVQSYFEHSAKIGNFRLGGQSKLHCFKSASSSFKVVNNSALQGLLDSIANNCHHGFYNLIDEDLMERKYGLGLDVSTDYEPTQADQAPQARPLLTAHGSAMIARRQHTGGAPLPSSPLPAQQQVDACDLNGFLSDPYNLMMLFYQFRSGKHDKHEDQFIARAAEEPIPLAETALGISLMSTGQTHDNADRSASVAAAVTSPGAATSPPQALSPPVLDSTSASNDDPSPAQPTTTRTLGKRKQKDVPAVGGAVANNNGSGDGPPSSSPKQEPKRQRAQRS